VWRALEWKKYDEATNYDISLNVEDQLDEEVPMTEQIKTPPPPPPPAAPEVIEVVEDEEEVEETIIESTETSQEEEVIEIEEVEVEEVEEDISIPFAVIEDVPVFPGCEGASDKKACFQEQMQKHIRKNFRYPEIAQEMGVQGRVNVMFVIQRDGSIGGIRMRGPDKNLEAEALRIINLLPKMTPGRQRGRPVKVPFSIPITFRLQ
jgi:protein TonB